MVGDVKQSIYAFRLADPSLFKNKYNEFGVTEAERDSERIILAENFRSRRNIDDFTNLIFKQLMDENLGELDYDDNAAYNMVSLSTTSTQPRQPNSCFMKLSRKRQLPTRN